MLNDGTLFLSKLENIFVSYDGNVPSMGTLLY
jgi:hypothetical protein